MSAARRKDQGKPIVSILCLYPEEVELDYVRTKSGRIASYIT